MQITYCANGFYFRGKIGQLRLVLEQFRNSKLTLAAFLRTRLH